MMSNRTNQGLAPMPAQERPHPGDGRGQSADQSHGERRPRESMARNPSPQAQHKSSPQTAASHAREWDDNAWAPEHDEAAGHRARRLLSRPSSGIHRIGDKFSALRRWIAGERWVKRLAVVIVALAAIFSGCFFGLWWR